MYGNQNMSLRNFKILHNLFQIMSCVGCDQKVSALILSIALSDSFNKSKIQIIYHLPKFFCTFIPLVLTVMLSWFIHPLKQ